MIGAIDGFLNRITMYRLTLYCLLGFWAAGFGLSVLRILPYDPIGLAASVIFLTAACRIANSLFARAFNVPANVESVYITALILALIIAPPESGHYLASLPIFIWAPALATASKYVLAIRKKHIFNPAAFAVAVTAFAINQPASWWVGTLAMAPFVAVGGFLVVRKTRRFDLVASFLVAASAVILGAALWRGFDILAEAGKIIFETPFLFFAMIMLTEPLTMPPTKILRLGYGTLVGLLFAPWVRIGSFFFTPESALLAGNIFSYAVSPKEKLALKLERKIAIAPDMYDFSFTGGSALKFRPGQYLEWTLGHSAPDSRGNRRYFTIASSPTEAEIKLGVKFYDHPSSFKNALVNLPPGGEITASQLAGDFVLPEDKSKKLIFIAGGIGITPFRSMLKYLLDLGESRRITLFYSNRTAAEIVYKDIFDEAEKRLGIKIVYTLTEAKKIPAGWTGERGYVTEEMIKRLAPEYKESAFYISGPRSLVTAFREVLKKMGIRRKQIKTDFFPGFA